MTKMFTVKWTEKHESGNAERMVHGVVRVNVTSTWIDCTFDSVSPIGAESFPVFGKMISFSMTPEE